MNNGKDNKLFFKVTNNRNNKLFFKISDGNGNKLFFKVMITIKVRSYFSNGLTTINVSN